MSKSSSKNEKYNCLANCLPMKGCLQRGKRRPSIPSNAASVVYNLTDGTGKMESTFGQQDAKSALTKQWLHNVSTVANFDPSYSNDSNMDSTLSSSSPSKKENSRHGNNARRSVSCNHRDPDSRNHCQDGRPRYEEDRYASAVKRNLGNGNASEIGANNAAVNDDSCRSDVDGCDCCDCSSSSSLNDSSRLSSDCCRSSQRQQRQQRQPRRRRIFEHGVANNSASSSVDGSGERNAAYERYRLRLDPDSSLVSRSSTLSLSTESVILDMDACRNLGITIVGHSNSTGDTGIYIGCIKKGGAVARCGRIEPGDLILDINGIELERMRNEDALATLKAEVAKGGLVRMVVAKYWDMTPSEQSVVKENYMHTESLYETVASVRSVSTKAGSAEVVVSSEVSYLETTQRKTGNVLRAIPEDNTGGGSGGARQFHEATGMSSADLERLFDLSKAARRFGFGGLQAFGSVQSQAQQTGSSSHMSSASSSRGFTPFPDSGYHDGRCVTSAGSCHSLLQQSTTTDCRAGFATMEAGSVIGGGSVRGRRTNILDASSSSFCGVDLVNWIHAQVAGLRGRQEAVAYAQNLLQNGQIGNTDPRQGSVFQEQGYYTFGHALRQGAVEPPVESKML